MSKSHDYDPIPTALAAPEILLNPTSGFGDYDRPFQGIPTIERSAGGRLWAAWYAGGPWECWQNYVIVVTSDDNGASWSEPYLVVNPGGTVRAFDGCLWLDPLGRLWLFWAQSMSCKEPKELFMDGQYGVWAIITENPDDEHPIWSAPRRIGDGIMMNKPVVLNSGEWMLPISIWKPLQHMSGQEPPVYHRMGERVGAYAVISPDNGQTFEYIGKCDTHENPTFDEHIIVERKDGSLWMLIRTAGGGWESSSFDGGKTWSQGNVLPFCQDARFYLRRLSSGRLLMVRNAPPEDVKRSHLMAFLSEDDGKSWHGGLMLDERLGVSYPDGTQDADGTIYVIYDYNRSSDREIYMAIFTEEDIISREWISAVAQPRVLVNKAKGAGSNRK